MVGIEVLYNMRAVQNLNNLKNKNSDKYRDIT